MENKNILISIGILLLLIAVFSILRYLKQRKIFRFIQTQNFSELEKELDSITTRMLIKPYNRENIRLNMYLMERDKKKINEQFERLYPILKKPLQNQEFLTKMFQHYLFEQDEKRCKKLLGTIQESIQQASILHEAQMLFQIFFENSSAYINELKQKMETMENEQKAMCAYYISLQYENKKDEYHAQKYRELSKHLF